MTPNVRSETPRSFLGHSAHRSSAKCSEMMLIAPTESSFSQVGRLLLVGFEWKSFHINCTRLWAEAAWAKSSAEENKSFITSQTECFVTQRETNRLLDLLQYFTEFVTGFMSPEGVKVGVRTSLTLFHHIQFHHTMEPNMVCSYTN